ncbi:NAD(P)/FAD-dependent oxidoreductase [Nocardia sp. NPDC020380]|uniref:NAD(P)/FAD-dependent oxidoreductase n=1 Tax=Nocardia sp. NPDC020380 TaxID=3364309 RepID=UPI0037A5EE29
MTGRIVIVGTGVAGATAAKTLRTEGYSGEIILLGAEPSLPYRRPMVSKELLADTAEERRTLLQPGEFWRDHTIELRTATTVERIDPASHLAWLADGTAIGYDTLLLATGALPRALPAMVGDGSGSGTAGHRPDGAGGSATPVSAAVGRGGAASVVHTLRGRGDVEAVRAAIAEGGSLVIVGGGLIGCEVAATARGLGVRVTLLHAGETLLDRVAPAVVGEYYRKLHADNGVEVVTGVLLDRLEEGAGVTAIAADGRRWVASAALVAIGAVPDTRLAEGSGLAVGEGIRVDERYRTSAAGIFAAGDAASRFDSASGEYRREEHWNSAQAQGAAAARSMLGLPAAPEEVSWGWSQQYGRNLQFAGMIRPGHEVIVRGDAAAGDVTVLGLDAGRLVGAVGVGRPAEIRAARDLIARRVVLDSAECADPTRPLGAVTALSGQS